MYVCECGTNRENDSNDESRKGNTVEFAYIDFGYIDSSSISVVLKVVDINPQGSIGPYKRSKTAMGSNEGL